MVKDHRENQRQIPNANMVVYGILFGGMHPVVFISIMFV